MVANEGMVGISIFLGAPNSLNRALVQGQVRDENDGSGVSKTHRA